MKTGVVKYNSSKTCFFLPLFSTRSGSFSKVRFILLKSCIPVWLQCGGSHFTILSPACQPVWPTGGSWFWLQKGDDLLIKYFEWEAMRLFLYSIYICVALSYKWHGSVYVHCGYVSACLARTKYMHTQNVYWYNAQSISNNQLCC